MAVVTGSSTTIGAGSEDGSHSTGWHGMGHRLKAIQYIEDAKIEKDDESSNLHNSGNAWFSNNSFANFLDGTNEN